MCNAYAYYSPQVEVERNRTFANEGLHWYPMGKVAIPLKEGQSLEQFAQQLAGPDALVPLIFGQFRNYFLHNYGDNK